MTAPQTIQPCLTFSISQDSCYLGFPDEVTNFLRVQEQFNNKVTEVTSGIFRSPNKLMTLQPQHFIGRVIRQNVAAAH